jgi:hypothetical protein
LHVLEEKIHLQHVCNFLDNDQQTHVVLDRTKGTVLVVHNIGYMFDSTKGASSSKHSDPFI